MDEYNLGMLSSSKDEWISRIISILTPLIIEGIKSIFFEAFEVCKKTNEQDKYLMTFQNFISRIPKWNNTIIENERKRIIEKSGCAYFEDLLTCVHIIQLKLLTAVRVGQKQKKIDINIVKIDEFIHKVYINVARKVYKNVYLFQLNIEALQIQKNNRELEIIIQECILFTIRDSIPIENILKVYLNETIEEDVTEEINEKIINEKIDYNIINKEIQEQKEKEEKIKQEKIKQEKIKQEKENKERENQERENQENQESENEEKNNNIKITFDNIPSLNNNDKNKISYNNSDDENDDLKLNILDDNVILDDVEDLNYLDNKINSETNNEIKSKSKSKFIDDIEVLI
jgi:hypothetical protein